MTEIASFRIVRAPRYNLPSAQSFARYPRPDDMSEIEQKIDASKFPPTITVDWPRELVRIIRPREGHTIDSNLRQLSSLHALLHSMVPSASDTEASDALALWASSVAGSPIPREIAAETLVKHADWKKIRVQVGDSILIQSATNNSIADLQLLCSWFLVICLVEDISLTSVNQLTTPEGLSKLFERFVLIPPQFLKRDTFECRGSLLVRQPAFCDHVVIREEWSCYKAGEVAHIENVLAGEKKTRTHVRTEETR